MGKRISTEAEGKDIVNLQHYADAFRCTGYKNAESAIAEIIDNSLEAGAKDVFVIASSNLNEKGTRVVDEIAVLDNGSGMDRETLHNSLIIGDGSRRMRKGMGRFGVGLPQASMAMCPRVEVYSWQESESPYFTYLDISQMKAGTQRRMLLPEKKEVPEKYKKFINVPIEGRKIDCSGSGTLVVWKNCDRLNRKKVATIFERFEFILGRKFRYWITNKRSFIRLVALGDEHLDRFIKPNDPLLLMKDNLVLGNPKDPGTPSKVGEPVFEPYHDDDILGATKIIESYVDKDGKEKKAEITVRFSIAKEVYHDAGGDSPLGKHLRKLVGVSIVRAEREIDFGVFGFFGMFGVVNELQHRFWGCEVLFGPELDEHFGVANNKQQVQLEAYSDGALSDEEASLYDKLHDVIRPTITKMFARLKERKKGSRSKGKATPPEVTVNIAESDNKSKTFSLASREELTREEVIKSATEMLTNEGNPSPTKDEVQTLLDNKVNLRYRDLGSNTFIDVYKTHGICVLTINTGSLFYQKLYSELEKEYGEGVRKAFDLVLMAFARAEDESYMNDDLRKAFADVRDAWGTKIRKYLEMDYEA